MRPTLSLVAACAVLALQGCDVRVADNPEPAQSAAPAADTQAQTAPAPVAQTQPPALEAPAGIPAQQPPEPLDAGVAVAPQDAAPAASDPQAAALPGAPADADIAPSGSAVMGGPGTPAPIASTPEGTAAPTEMSEFFANGGTPTENRK